MRGVGKLTLPLAAVAALFASAAVPVLAHTEGNDFVCPVFKSEAVGEHNPNAFEIYGGHYSLLPGKADHLGVPDHATNMDGQGSPGGPHSAPGDPDYTAIWNGD